MYEPEGSAGVPRLEEVGPSGQHPGDEAAVVPTMTAVVHPPSYAPAVAQSAPAEAPAQFEQPEYAAPAQFVAPGLVAAQPQTEHVDPIEPVTEPVAESVDAMASEPDWSPVAIPADGYAATAYADDAGADEPAAQEATVDAIAETPTVYSDYPAAATEAEPAEATPAEPDWYNESDTVENEVVEAQPVDNVETIEVEPMAEAVEVEAEPVTEPESVTETEAEPVAEVDAEPVADIEAVEPEPVAEIEEVEVEPIAEAIEVEPAAEIAEVAIEPAAEATEADSEPMAGAETEESLGEAAAIPSAESLTVLPGESVLEFRARMIAVHEQFDQAPVDAVAQAELIVTDAVAALHEALLDNAVHIGSWRQTERPDAEQLGDALRRYRDYLDKVLAL